MIITDDIEIILNINSFPFDNKNNIKTLGTAMRTRMAPTFASLTLAYSEENLYEIIGQKFNKIKQNLLDLLVSIL